MPDLAELESIILRMAVFVLFVVSVVKFVVDQWRR